MASRYTPQVVAVIDTASSFGATVKQLKDNVTALQTQMSTLLADAPETLDTLNEIAAAISDDPTFFSTMSTANTTLQNNIDAEATTRTTVVAALQALVDAATTARGLLSGRLDTLEADATTGTALAAVQADVDANEADHDAAIALKFDKAGGTLTGSLAIAKSFPDVELKAGDEKRILFSDAGGGSTAAIKHVSTTLDFYAGGIAAGNKEMSIGTDGVDVSALKIDGTAVTATAAEINAFDSRLDTLEADPVTKTYVDTQVTNVIDAAPGALDTLNELAAALGDDANFATTITNSIAAVQTDVNQNETDADAAIAAVQADVDQNEADADAAITAANVAMLAAVATVQADVDQNEADADAAIAAVQADVDQNETDADTAIALKANIASPTFTGTVGGITKSMVGLGNVDNTADTAKPVSTAQQTAIDAVQADVDQNESDADAAIAAVQADVDQNEADADTAIALKANKAGDTFTGDILLRNPSGNAVALRLSRADHPDMSCEWKVTPSYVSSTKECLSILAAGQPVAHFDERQRVSINKTDPDYTLDVAGDGKFSTDLTVGGSLTLGSTAITATGAELNYCDGVTSNIQTQLDAISSFDNNNSTLTGTTVAANLDISGDIDVDGTTNLDNVDIDGNTNFDGTITIATTPGSTDYSEVVLTNLSPSSFNQTYGRQSTGFVLDTGTVASGNALFHADSNYYYYVATTGSGANGRALVWSVEDNKWVTIFDMSGNFTEGNVSNNDAVGSVFTDDVIATSQTQDGRSVPTASSDVTYATSAATSGLTNAANDSAAATAGVAVGQFYRNGSVVMIRVS